MAPKRPTRPTASRIRAAKPRGYKRMEERKATEWKPLSDLENRSLCSVKDSDGEYKIDRQVLAKLLGERDRLAFVAESARFLLESCEAQPMDTLHEQKLRPTDIEKAMGATRRALAAFDGDAVRASRS